MSSPTSNIYILKLTKSARIFKLQDASSAWVEMKQTLKIGRYHPVAFIVPDEITNCTLL
jgi:hypothetical protein